MSLRLTRDVQNLKEALDRLREFVEEELERIRFEKEFTDALKPRKPGRPKREETK